MKFKATETIYFIYDLDTSIKFYTEKLGFKLIEKEDWGWALLEIDGNQKLGLLTEATWRQANSEDDQLPRPRVALKTDDIEAFCSCLAERGVSFDKIFGDKGQMRATIFRDHDGNEFFVWDDGKPL